MEDTLLTDIFEADLDDEGKEALAGVSQWGYINAIVGFISLGISVVVLFVTLGNAEGIGIIPLLFTNFISFAISLLLNITLYSATQTLTASLKDSDQGMFIAGLSKLSKFFKILGILLIIFLSLAVIIFLIGIVGALMYSGGFK